MLLIFGTSLGCMTIKEQPSLNPILVEGVDLSIPPKHNVRVALSDDGTTMVVPVEDMRLLANWVVELEKRYSYLGDRWRILVEQLKPYMKTERK